MEQQPREKYQLTLDQRHFFGTQGYLKVEGLLSEEDLRELDRHSMDMALGQVDFSQLEGVTPRSEGDTPADMEDKFFRFIQFHRHLEVHERFLLHLRILDVLETLIGPDVMAMQSMLFLKATEEIRSGLSSGFLLHQNCPGHAVWSLDSHRQL